LGELVAGHLVGEELIVHDLAGLGKDHAELEVEGALLLLQPQDVLLRYINILGLS
jgi:hypothetical protein